MIYTILGGIAIAILISIFIVGLLCTLLIASDSERDYKSKKVKKSKKK